MADKKSVKMIVTFAERGMGKSLAKLYGEHGVALSFMTNGWGTASSELLDVLGVGTAEKDILFCLAAEGKALRLMNLLDNELQGKVHGKGIAFDLPLTGLNSLLATVLMGADDNRTTGGNRMSEKADHSLILITVNQGHTDAVMDTARQAGAGGGTVLRARWAGTEEAGQFQGMSLQPEREILAIVASTEKRNAIMEMVNKKHGLKSEAGALICSMEIEHMVHLA